jgi:hypothetical protein
MHAQYYYLLCTKKMKIEKSEILEILGSLFLAKANEGRILPGCTFVLPSHRLREFKREVGVGEDYDKPLKFMGVPIVESQTEGDEILLTETDAPLPEHLDLNLTDAIAAAMRDQQAALSEGLRSAFERIGITFADRRAMFQYCALFTEIKSTPTHDVVMYEGKELFAYQTNVSLSKNGDGKIVVVSKEVQND